MPSLDAMEGTCGKEVRADRIQLNLLGGSEASRGGRPIAFRTRKSLALLVYLAVDPGPHPRERLADLLWPESGVADARASLRTALNYMRHGLGPSADSVVLATRESLGVRRGAPVDVDVQALARAQRLARLEGNTLGDEIVTAVAQYRGPFLAGMLLSDAPDFEAWVETQRTYWRGVESELLDRVAARQMAEGDAAGAISTLERWTSLNPDEELAWRRLIDVHMRTDDAAGARRTWSAYGKTLAEFDAKPSRQMAEAYDQILGRRDANVLSGPAATVTLGIGAASWKARLVSQFLKSIGSAEPEVAELERWLTAPRRSTATLRLELKTTVDVEHPAAVPALAFAV